MALLLTNSQLVSAQDNTSNQDQPKSTNQIQFSDLDTYYLRNNAGDLIPIFKFSFEDFERMMRAQDQDAPMASDFVSKFQIASAGFAGSVSSKSGTASIRMTLDILVSQSGTIEIPIGMNQWALTGPIESSGANFSLHRDANQGLKITFSAENEKQYKLTLPLTCKLLTIAESQQLAFPFPHTTKTDFQLRIDRPNLTLDSSGMIGVQVDKEEEATIISARELSESASLVWRESDSDAMRFRTKAQVTSTTTLESISVNRWQANTTVQIRPLDQPVDELVMIAPSHSKDYSIAQSGIRLSQISFDEAAAKSSFISESLRDRTFLLMTTRPTAEPVEVTFSYLYEPEIASDQSAVDFEIDGLQVLDCVFLSGTLNLASSQKQLDTTLVTSTGITPVYNRPNVKSGKSFEISRQDFSLTLTARQRPARISIAPEFTLALGGGTEGRIAILTVKYKGTIQGQYNDVLSVPLANWTRLDLKGQSIEEQEGNLLLNPAERTDLTSNAVNFEFSVQQVIAEDDIDLSLPIPISNPTVLLEPATLIVIPMVENREFSLDTKQSAFEVNQQASTSEFKDSATVQFRSKSGSDSLRLKGTISLKPRVIEYEHSVDVLSPASGVLQQYPLRVRQTIQIDIRNQPLQRLWFLAKNVGPQARLAVSGADVENGIPRTVDFQLKELSINNETWYAVEPLILDRQLRGAFLFEWEDHSFPTTDSLSNKESAEKIESSIAILQPMVTTELTNPAIESEADLVAWQREQTAKFLIRQRSFNTPLEGALEYQLDSNWVTDLQNETEPPKQRWLAFGNWPFVTKITSWERFPENSQVTIEDVELQTWWQDDQRLDRVIVGIRNAGDSLSLRLPSVSRPEQVLLDGIPIPFDPVQEDGTFSIVLKRDISNSTIENSKPNSEEDAYQIVELWISQPSAAGWWHNAKANLPEFPNQQWCRNFRWRILANHNWQCVSWSPQFFSSPRANSALTHVSLEGTRGRDAWSSRREFESYIDTNPLMQEGSTQELAANQIPEEASILLINRFWIRLVSICLAFAAVTLIWAAGWFRSFYLWIAIAFGFALLYAAAPLLFSQILPFLAVSTVVAIGVLLVDNFSRSKPSIVMEMDTFVGSTRTLTIGSEHSLNADSNRSHGSQKQTSNSNSGAIEKQ